MGPRGTMRGGTAGNHWLTCQCLALKDYRAEAEGNTAEDVGVGEEEATLNHGRDPRPCLPPALQRAEAGRRRSGRGQGWRGPSSGAWKEQTQAHAQEGSRMASCSQRLPWGATPRRTPRGLGLVRGEESACRSLWALASRLRLCPWSGRGGGSTAHECGPSHCGHWGRGCWPTWGPCCPTMQQRPRRVTLHSYDSVKLCGDRIKPAKQDITQVRGPPCRRVAHEVLVHGSLLLLARGQQRLSLSPRKLESSPSCLGCS